mmetsp:Transcript_1112/g.1802  ORF Transcript_1112/g.1802 Transcript_1112/m.1802 type:complete len:291 (+) Transcript_1112:561-1433(+)
MNGIFMDSFPRPDIAEGIFYEYLRLDNPMSFDFLDRVVEGFPFLLAPLSQVKGVTSPVITQHAQTQEAVAPSGNPLFRTIGGFGDAISSQAASIADFVQSGAHDLSSSALDKVRSIGEEVERKRELIGKHVSAFTNQAMSSFYPKDQKSLSIPFPGWISETELSKISGELSKQSSEAKQDRKRSVTNIVCHILGLEVSSMSASSVSQKLFFSLVHLYLLLLLIASFPAQWTTRTKLVVVTRKGSLNATATQSDSDISDSDDSGISSVGIHDAPMTPEKEMQIKKSLSYVL